MTVLGAQEEAEAREDVDRERKEKDAEIARLRAALKPFAEFGKVYGTEGYMSDIPDHADVATARVDGRPLVLRVGDLRAAIKALEGT